MVRKDRDAKGNNGKAKEESSASMLTPFRVGNPRERASHDPAHPGSSIRLSKPSGRQIPKVIRHTQGGSHNRLPTGKSVKTGAAGLAKPPGWKDQNNPFDPSRDCEFAVDYRFVISGVNGLPKWPGAIGNRAWRSAPWCMKECVRELWSVSRPPHGVGDDLPDRGMKENRVVLRAGPQIGDSPLADCPGQAAAEGLSFFP